jgi:hypothetical protein
MALATILASGTFVVVAFLSGVVIAGLSRRPRR